MENGTYKRNPGLFIATLLALLLTAGAVRAGDTAPAGAGATMEQIHAECIRLTNEEQVLACIQERLPAAVDLPPHLQASVTGSQDPAINAAIDAWWTRAHAAVNAHASRLAATGPSRGLLQAAILWHPRWEETAHDQPLTLHPRTTDWFARARAARPVDPLVDWLDAHHCAGFPNACDPDAARARLLRREPGNIAVQLLELESRHDTGDRAGTRNALAAAAAGTHARTHHPGFLRLLLDAYQGVEWPQVPAALAMPFAERLGWRESFDGADAGLILAIGQSSSLTLPARQALLQVCNPQQDEPAMMADCLIVLQRLADSGETVIDAMVSLRRLTELTAGTPAHAGWQERLRGFLWLYETAARLQTSNMAQQMDLERYVEVFAESGELVAMRMLLEHHGLPLEPPDGWLPISGMEGLEVAGEDGARATPH